MKRASRMNIAPIGLVLVKHWFQVHGVEPQGQAVVRRSCGDELRPTGLGIAHFRNRPARIGQKTAMSMRSPF
jgi:hypothetical protein